MNDKKILNATLARELKGIKESLELLSKSKGISAEQFSELVSFLSKSFGTFKGDKGDKLLWADLTDTQKASLKGYTPRRGKDYMTLEDLHHIAQRAFKMVKMPVRGKDWDTPADRAAIIAELAKLIKNPIKGKDYFTKKEVADLIYQVQKKVKPDTIIIRETTKAAVKSVLDDPEAIARALETLKGGQRLSASAIKGLPSPFVSFGSSGGADGGAGTITGSGISGQITFWDGVSSITGSTALVYDGDGIVTLESSSNPKFVIHDLANETTAFIRNSGAEFDHTIQSDSNPSLFSAIHLQVGGGSEFDIEDGASTASELTYTFGLNSQTLLRLAGDVTGGGALLPYGLAVGNNSTDGYGLSVTGNAFLNGTNLSIGVQNGPSGSPLAIQLHDGDTNNVGRILWDTQTNAKGLVLDGSNNLTNSTNWPIFLNPLGGDIFVGGSIRTQDDSGVSLNLLAGSDTGSGLFGNVVIKAGDYTSGSASAGTVEINAGISVVQATISMNTSGGDVYMGGGLILTNASGGTLFSQQGTLNITAGSSVVSADINIFAASVTASDSSVYINGGVADGIGGGSGNLFLGNNQSGSILIGASANQTEVLGDLKVDKALLDASNSPGGSVDFFTSTGSATSWLPKSTVLSNMPKITVYNGITVYSNGVPSIVAPPVNLTGQTAAKTTTTMFTPGSDGMYRISVYLQVTTAASTSSVLGGATGVVIQFQDGYGNITQTDTVALATTAGAIAINAAGNTTATNLHGSIEIYAKASGAITYAIGYTSVGVTPMQYAARLMIEAL